MRCARIREQGFTRLADGEYIRRPYARVGKLDKKRVRSETPESDSSAHATPAKTGKRNVSALPVARHTLDPDLLSQRLLSRGDLDSPDGKRKPCQHAGKHAPRVRNSSGSKDVAHSPRSVHSSCSPKAYRDSTVEGALPSASQQETPGPAFSRCAQPRSSPESPLRKRGRPRLEAALPTERGRNEARKEVLPTRRGLKEVRKRALPAFVAHVACRNLRSGSNIRPFRRKTRSMCRPGIAFKALSLSRRTRTCAAKTQEKQGAASARNPIRLLHALHARAVGATKLSATVATQLTAANVEALSDARQSNVTCGDAFPSGRSKPRSASRSTRLASGLLRRRRSHVSKDCAISIASSCSANRRREVSPARAGFAMSSLRGRARKRVSSESSDRTEILSGEGNATPVLMDVSEHASGSYPTERNALQSENPNLRGRTLKRVSSDSSNRVGKSPERCASSPSARSSPRVANPKVPNRSFTSPLRDASRACSSASPLRDASRACSADTRSLRGIAISLISSSTPSCSSSLRSESSSPLARCDSPKKSRKLPVWPVRLQTPKIVRAPFRSSEKDERNLRAVRRRNAKAWSSELSERTRIFGVPQDVLDNIAGYLSQSDKFVACMAHKLFHFTNEPRFHPTMDLTPVGASAAVSGRIRRPAEGSVHHLQLLRAFITTQKRFCEVSVINIQKRALFQLHEQLLPLFETHCPKAMILMIQDHQTRILTSPQTTISVLHRILRGRQIKQVVIEDCVNHKFLISIDSSVGETCAAFLSHGGQCQKKKISGGAFCPLHAKKQPFGHRT